MLEMIIGFSSFGTALYCSLMAIKFLDGTKTGLFLGIFTNLVALFFYSMSGWRIYIALENLVKIIK
jgi:hypothetical protein